MKTIIKLKPCDRCGCKNVTLVKIHNWIIQCLTCGKAIARSDKGKVVSEWNKLKR